MIERLNQRLREFPVTVYDRETGSVWYGDACRRLSDLKSECESPLPGWKIAAITAAISPLKSWPINIEILTEYLQGKPVRELGIFPVLRSKILAIESCQNFDHALTILRGAKITNFAKNLNGNFQAVTVDSHMLNFFGVKTTPKRIRVIEATVSDSKIGKNPASSQAILWVNQRRYVDAKLGQNNAY